MTFQAMLAGKFKEFFYHAGSEPDSGPSCRTGSDSGKYKSKVQGTISDTIGDLLVAINERAWYRVHQNCKNSGVSTRRIKDFSPGSTNNRPKIW